MFGIIMSAYLQFGMLDGVGWVPKTWNEPDQGSIIVTEKPLYTDLGFKVELGVLFAEADVLTTMYQDNWNSFQPVDNTYSIGGGISYKGITAGIKHTCYHPMAAYSMYHNYRLVNATEGSTNDIYMRLEIGGKR